MDPRTKVLTVSNFDCICNVLCYLHSWNLICSKNASIAIKHHVPIAPVIFLWARPYEFVTVRISPLLFLLLLSINYGRVSRLTAECFFTCSLCLLSPRGTSIFPWSSSPDLPVSSSPKYYILIPCILVTNLSWILHPFYLNPF